MSRKPQAKDEIRYVQLGMVRLATKKKVKARAAHFNIKIGDFADRVLEVALEELPQFRETAAQAS
jgi:hypothetical protein